MKSDSVESKGEMKKELGHDDDMGSSSSFASVAENDDLLGAVRQLIHLVEF